MLKTSLVLRGTTSTFSVLNDPASPPSEMATDPNVPNVGTKFTTFIDVTLLAPNVPTVLVPLARPNTPIRPEELAIIARVVAVLPTPDDDTGFRIVARIIDLIAGSMRYKLDSGERYAMTEPGAPTFTLDGTFSNALRVGAVTIYHMDPQALLEHPEFTPEL